ncbi:MAG: hypothetical protein DCC68_14285 [Planctomycetota bacterium]|nr:MAG: hypothetical protein DCC68_14285 [Planctomycetota bacterium]
MVPRFVVRRSAFPADGAIMGGRPGKFNDPATKQRIRVSTVPIAKSSRLANVAKRRSGQGSPDEANPTCWYSKHMFRFREKLPGGPAPVRDLAADGFSTGYPAVRTESRDAAGRRRGERK